jgi:hypothetical protein
MNIFNKNILLLTILLSMQTLSIFIYTAYAFAREGYDLFSIFIDNMLSLNWNGQFNLDFSCYLTLSGLWIMWRNKFDLSAIIFGVIAMILGIIVFAPYILYLLAVEKGNLKNVLIGNR